MDKDSIIILVSNTSVTIMTGIVLMALQFMFIDKISDLYIALLPVFFWSVNIIASPFWGSFSDVSHNRKWILEFTLLGAGTIIFLHAIFTAYWNIVILRILSALFVAAFIPLSLAIFTQGKPKEELGRRASLFNLSRSLGFFLSGYVASLTLLFFTTRWLFVVSSILVFLASGLVLFLNEPKRSNSISFKKSLRDSLHIPGRGFIRKNNSHYVIFGLSLRHIGIMGMFSLLFVYLTRLGIENYVSSALSSFNTLAQMLTMYFFGYLADKIGRKKVYVIGFFGSSLVPLLFLLSRGLIEISLSFIFLGVSFSLMISGVTPFIKDIAPEGKEGEALSFLNITRGIGFIAGPIVAGILVEFIGYAAMFLAMSLISFVGAVFSLLGKETLMAKMMEIEKRELVAYRLN
ncbi:MAG: MFS transporter [Candidatus Njordarchaeia archaeon]